MVRLLARCRPTLFTTRLHITHRAADIIIAVGPDWTGREATIAISPITIDWMERFCPRIVQRYEPYDVWFIETETKRTGSAYLDRHFGGSEELILSGWPTDVPKPTGKLTDKFETIPFPARFSGLDEWMLLRPLVPTDMDFRWVAVATDAGHGNFVLRFYRSWTSSVIYELDLKPAREGLQSEQARYCVDPEIYGSETTSLEVAKLSDLVGNSLLGRQTFEPN